MRYRIRPRMDHTTIRMPRDDLEEIRAEADARNLTLSAYIRRILNARELILGEIDGSDETPLERIDRLEEHVDELTARVDDVESSQLSNREPSSQRP